MANPAYMTITGRVQGLISAGCSSKESIGNRYQSAHVDEIMVLSCSYNMANLEKNNKPIHSPIILGKFVDKASPLLSQAQADQEKVECTISFYRTSALGAQEKFYTISIKGGLITDVTFDMPDVLLQSDAELREQVAIRYREIKWTNHLTSTSGYAVWDEER